MWQTQGKNGGYPEAHHPITSSIPLRRIRISRMEESYFHPKEWNGLTALEIMQRGMDKLLDEYEQAGIVRTMPFS